MRRELLHRKNSLFAAMANNIWPISKPTSDYFKKFGKPILLLARDKDRPKMEIKR
jgi:hypothetical protein